MTCGFFDYYESAADVRSTKKTWLSRQKLSRRDLFAKLEGGKSQCKQFCEICAANIWLIAEIGAVQKSTHLVDLEKFFR